MSTMCVQSESSNLQRYHGDHQGYEKGESSNTNRSQGDAHFDEGSGYAGNGGRSFKPQQMNNYNNYNNMRYSGHTNNTFRNSNSDRSDGLNTKGNQNSFGRNGSRQGNGWQGNTSYRSSMSPECQICYRRGHTASNCYYRSTQHQNQSFGNNNVCQICGKIGHIALDCYHMNNYSYQGNHPQLHHLLV